MSKIKIISNSSNDSHLESLKRLIKEEATRLIIASPFLGSNFKKILSKFNFDNVGTIEVITTLKPQDPEQLTKPDILKAYFEYFTEKYPEKEVKLHIDNKLHGKMYITTYEENNTAILGSANFTENGLCNNHEWGVEIKDNTVIKNIINALFDSCERKDVTKDYIENACVSVAEYKSNNPEWGNKQEIPNILEDRVPNYFVKPMGVSENPIMLTDQRDFSDLYQNLHFSTKKKPVGVKKGDILIAIAVGGQAFISYYEVIGERKQATPEEIDKEPWKERWAWYMKGKNLAQEFSKNWGNYKVQKEDVIREFLEKNPNATITHAGGKNLNALNYGSDKVRITENFGKFLISKIKSSVKKYNTKAF